MSKPRLYGHNKRKGKPSLTWEVLGKEAMKGVLNEIEPHLILKKEQARLCLWWIDNMSGRQPKNGCQPELSQARRIFSDELKLMKLDPQRLSEEAVLRISALMR